MNNTSWKKCQRLLSWRLPPSKVRFVESVHNFVSKTSFKAQYPGQHHYEKRHLTEVEWQCRDAHGLR